MLAGHNATSELAIFDDPEAIFLEGWLLCDLGEHTRGLPYLERALARGYYVSPTLQAQSAVRRAARHPRI